MPDLSPVVSEFFANGCGRCALGGTPQCSVHLWPEALEKLRFIALATGLTEKRKWGVPYFVNEHGKNIAWIGAFKEYCMISFLQGALLNDSHHVLQSPNSNSESTRQIRFTSGGSVEAVTEVLTALLLEATALEAAGKKLEPKKAVDYDVPAELSDAFALEPELMAAFDRLTPGRQKTYILHFGQPVHSKTRIKRIDKARSDIMNGIGLHDRYRR